MLIVEFMKSWVCAPTNVVGELWSIFRETTTEPNATRIDIKVIEVYKVGIRLRCDSFLVSR